MPDRLVVTLCALIAVLLVAGTRRSCGRFALWLLRWIASPLHLARRCCARAGSGRDFPPGGLSLDPLGRLRTPAGAVSGKATGRRIAQDLEASGRPVTVAAASLSPPTAGGTCF